MLGDRPSMSGWGAMDRPHQFTKNSLHRAIDVPRNIEVPEPERLITLAYQKTIARSISCAIARQAVLLAIDLDRKPRFMFGKVQCIDTEWRLAAKMVTPSVELAQLPPQTLFLLRHIAAQTTGATDVFRSRSLEHRLPPTRSPTLLRSSGVRPPHKGGGKKCYIAARAWARSSQRSATSSRPTARRIMPSVTPNSARASALRR